MMSEDNNIIWILPCELYNMLDIASVSAFELVWYHDTRLSVSIVTLDKK